MELFSQSCSSCPCCHGKNIHPHCTYQTQNHGLRTIHHCPSGVSSANSTLAIGQGGNIVINTGDLNASDLSEISVASRTAGDGGNLSIASGEIRLSSGSLLSADTTASGNAGVINIQSRTMTLQDSSIRSNTLGSGRAGNMRLNIADTLDLDAGAIEALTTAGSTGNGGDIFMDARATTLKASRITLDSAGTGVGGSLQLNSPVLNMNNSSISAQTLSSDGGSLTLNVPQLLILRNNSLISTQAGTAAAGGNGGNITINALFVVGPTLENSDITANAFSGRGGNITINTQAIFGLAFRPRLTPLSDITASSEFGLQGTVIINTPDVDPSRGVVELPGDVTDASRQIAQGCGNGQESGRFVVAGRGGLPTSPSDPLVNDALWEDRRIIPAQLSRQGSAPVPAQGWVQDGQGEITLVARSQLWDC